MAPSCHLNLSKSNPLDIGSAALPKKSLISDQTNSGDPKVAINNPLLAARILSSLLVAPNDEQIVATFESGRYFLIISGHFQQSQLIT